MIKHIVTFKMKESAGGCNKIMNAEKLKEMLDTLPDLINVIRYFEVGINFTEADNAMDLVLLSTFNTETDLEQYINHPEHQKIVEFINEVCESRYLVDYHYNEKKNDTTDEFME